MNRTTSNDQCKVLFNFEKTTQSFEIGPRDEGCHLNTSNSNGQLQIFWDKTENGEQAFVYTPLLFNGSTVTFNWASYSYIQMDISSNFVGGYPEIPPTTKLKFFLLDLTLP